MLSGDLYKYSVPNGPQNGEMRSSLSKPNLRISKDSIPEHRQANAEPITKKLVEMGMTGLYKVDTAKRKLFIEEKLKEFARDGEVQDAFAERLEECGWNTALKNYAKGLIREKGLGQVTPEDLEEIEEKVQAKGMNTVPLAIKDEIFLEIVTMLRDERLLPPEKKYNPDLGKY